jgi:hypothetical protein
MSRVLEVDITVAGEPSETEGLTRGSRDDDSGVLSRRFARRHGLHLLGAAACWFVLDVVVYSQNILQEKIFSDAKWVPKACTMSALEEAHRIARAHAIIALCGTVPGYWFAVAFVDVIGRKAIQCIGFAMMMAFMLAMAALYDGLTASPGRRTWLLVMYTFTFFFANFGPNSTTFVVPREDLPGAPARDVPRDVGGGGEDRRHRRDVRVHVRRAEGGRQRGGRDGVPVGHRRASDRGTHRNRGPDSYSLLELGCNLGPLLFRGGPANELWRFQFGGSRWSCS